MNKILVVLLIVIFLSTTANASVNEIYTCKELNIEGTTYILNANVNASGTCFKIGANNITLDGSGHYVNYSNVKSGFGVTNNGYSDVTIKNLNIIQSNKTSIYPDGILGVNFYNSSNGLILNVTVSVNREGIQVFKSNNINIINSKGISYTSVGIFNYLSNNINIINSIGISDINNPRFQPGIGIYFSNRNTFINSTGISNKTQI